MPSSNDPARHLTHGEHYGGWKRGLRAAGVPHVGTHGIRCQATTDITNSSVPTNIGMKLTSDKTVAMFMHYVHTENKPVRDAAELVASPGGGHHGCSTLCGGDGMIQLGLPGLSVVALETLPHPSAQSHGSIVATLLRQFPYLPSIPEQI